ncbi:MAG: ATP-binding cassette domain-containing protein [Candidatus Acidiferrales bacterium]
MDRDSRKFFAAEDNEPLLRVRNLSKDYVQRRPLTRQGVIVRALENVNLTIRRGTTLALVGESGAGKSTLGRCVALLERPTQGEIWFAGENLLACSLKRLLPIRRQIQFIFQDPTTALNPRMTAGEIISEPLAIQREGTNASRREWSRALLTQVGLPVDAEQKHPLEFSGGQRQRLAIARALSLEPQLLVLDEALASLDLRNQEMILRLLSDLQAAHALTYLHISHDLRMVAEFADEVAVMHEHQIVEQKSAAELFARPEHSHTRMLLDAMPALESICMERRA